LRRQAHSFKFNQESLKSLSVR